jgi:hypothetical protein
MVLWSMDTIVFSYANADNASLVNHLILLLHKSDVREQRARQAPSCGWCLASLSYNYNGTWQLDPIREFSA